MTGLLSEKNQERQRSNGAASRVNPGQVRGFAAHAREMATLSPGLIAYNFAYLALVWGLALGAIALFWAYPEWYTLALAILVVSSRQQALINCEHEAIHGKFVPSRRWNDLIGRYLCAAPVGSPYSAAGRRHLTHHRLLGTPEDPDRDLHSGDGKETRKGLAKHFVGGLLGGYAGMILMGPRAPRSTSSGGSAAHDLISLVIAQAILFAALTLLFAWWLYPLMWLAPLVTLTVLAHMVRSFVEHAITDSETGAHSNRLITIRSNLVERALVAPYGMNYHAEHHILPSVPAPRLRRLQKRLAASEGRPSVLVRPSYGRALWGYMRQLRD